MAEKLPFFLTGANARIVLNNKSVAFATDISFSVTVSHTAPRVLGRYEVESVQPLAYDVEGTLTIIRYGRGLKDYFVNGMPDDVNQKGNSIGSYGAQGINFGAIGLPDSKGQFDGGANDAFDPVRFFQSKQFDIEIRQKVPHKELASLGFNDDFVRDPTRPGADETSVVLLRDCRFTGLKFDLSKRTAATQTYSFKARYMDDDTFLARKSGVGQELS